MESFDKNTIVEFLGAWASIDMSDPELHSKVVGMFVDRDLRLEFVDKEARISTMDGRYVERARFDDVSMDFDGWSVLVDRINAAAERCAAFQAGNNVALETSPPEISENVISELIEEAEDYIVVNDVKTLFNNMLSRSAVRLSDLQGGVSVAISIDGIRRAPKQDSTTVVRYMISYSLHLSRPGELFSVSLVSDEVYTKCVSVNKLERS